MDYILFINEEEKMIIIFILVSFFLAKTHKRMNEKLLSLELIKCENLKVVIWAKQSDTNGKESINCVKLSSDEAFV